MLRRLCLALGLLVLAGAAQAQDAVFQLSIRGTADARPIELGVGARTDAPFMLADGRTGSARFEPAGPFGAIVSVAVEGEAQPRRLIVRYNRAVASGDENSAIEVAVSRSTMLAQAQ